MTWPGGQPPHTSRITHALNARNLFGPEVDRACMASEPDVDMWEAGSLIPTAEQVEALARLTAYPLEWFYRGPLTSGGIACVRGRGAKALRILVDPDPPEGCPSRTM